MIESRNPRILWAIAPLIAVCLVTSAAEAQCGGGTGEPNSPYLIHTAEQLNAIGAEPDDWDKRFKSWTYNAAPGSSRVRRGDRFSTGNRR